VLNSRHHVGFLWGGGPVHRHCIESGVDQQRAHVEGPFRGSPAGMKCGNYNLCFRMLEESPLLSKPYEEPKHAIRTYSAWRSYGLAPKAHAKGWQPAGLPHEEFQAWFDGSTTR